MKKILLNNWIPIAFYIILLCVSLYFVVSYSKVAIHLYINKFVGDSFMDSFFKYITYIGDGWFVPLFILLIIFFNTRLAVVCIISFLIAVVISLSLKYTIVDDVVRPWFTFQWEVHDKVNYVEGVQLYLYNSFPSGHSTQAFALLIPLMLFVRQNGFKFAVLLVALLAAFSRTYLSMHWFEDIVAGSFIGFCAALSVYYMIPERNKLIALDKGILNLKSKTRNE